MYTKNIFKEDWKNKRVDKSKIYTWCEDEDEDMEEDILEYLEKIKEHNFLDVEEIRIKIKFKGE